MGSEMCIRDSDNAINLLLSRTERQAARVYGTAIRLAVIASGRSPELLDKFNLTCSDAKLTLNVEGELSDLVSGRVTYRLQKLGNLMGVHTEFHK